MARPQGYLQEAYSEYQERWGTLMAARLRRRPLVRAGTLAALGGSSALNALLAACASPSEETTAQAGAKLAEGAYEHSPFALVDKYHWRRLPWGGVPHVGGDARDPRAPWNNVDLFRSSFSFQGLAWSPLTHVRFGEGADMERIEFEGDLASEYKPARDFSYWDFFLRRGARFHDIPPVNGREVTADDVKYSLDRYKDNSLFSAAIRFIDRIEVLDRYTVRIHTKRPILFAPQVLAQPQYSVVAPEHAEGDPYHFKTTAIGSGPFQVTYNQDRDRRELVRHSAWHFSDTRYPAVRLPFINKGTGYYFADTNAQTTAFRTGQIDWINADKKTLDDVLATNPQSNVQVWITAPPDGGLTWWLMQQRPGSPLQDVRLRRALSLSIDRQKLIEFWASGAGTYGSPIGFEAAGFRYPPGPEYYSRFWQRYEPDTARTLLAEAGYPNGFELEVLRSPATTENYYDLLEPMMAAAGIRLKFNRQESSIVSTLQARGEFQGIVAGTLSRSYALPIVAVSAFSRSAPTNYGGVDDPVLERMIDEAFYALDLDQQMRLLREVDEYVMDQVYHLVGWAPFNMWLFQPWLHNVANSIHPFFMFGGSWALALAWLDQQTPSGRGGKPL